MPSSAPNPVRGNDILQKSQAADVISALSITPSETLLKVAAPYFRKEVASFAEVDWRWINHEVLLTPIFWVVMFYTSPISSDQLQQTETLLPGPLIRDLKEILESRFPSISREQVNVFIRNWRAALSAVVSDLATSSQGAQMFVDRMKPELKRWEDEVFVLVDSETTATYGAASAQEAQRLRTIRQVNLPFGHGAELERILKKRGRGVSPTRRPSGEARVVRCRHCKAVAGNDAKAWFLTHNPKCPQKPKLSKGGKDAVT